MHKIRVLLVDDHPILCDGLRSLLTLQDDMEVVGEAYDGRGAIEKVHLLSPDIVLMDIAMPLMDGLEATRRISKEAPSVKVIILTQHDNKEYLLSSVHAGAAGCIPKKAVSSEMVLAIRAVYKGESFLHPSMAKILIDHHRTIIEGENDFSELTDREREILKLIAEGYTNQEIADMLIISAKTVMNHRTNIMEKLKIHNRTELIKYAIRKGIIIVET